MNPVFVYRPEIPKEFALSVMYILKGRGTSKNWNLLRDYGRQIQLEIGCSSLTFQWIESILLDNNIQTDEKELGWWKVRIVGN